MRKQTLPLNPHWPVERLRGAVRRVKLRVAMGGHHVPPQARQIAAHSADQLIVTENTTWHKLQKLSQVA